MRKRRVRRVARQADVAVYPGLQWQVDPQSPFEDVPLGYEVEELLNARAEGFESVEEVGFGAVARGPC